MDINQEGKEDVVAEEECQDEHTNTKPSKMSFELEEFKVHGQTETMMETTEPEESLSESKELKEAEIKVYVKEEMDDGKESCTEHILLHEVHSPRKKLKHESTSGFIAEGDANLQDFDDGGVDSDGWVNDGSSQGGNEEEAFHDITVDLDPDPFLALDAPSFTKGDRRGGRVLTYRGYRYHRSNSSQSRIYWRCARPKCGETIITNRFDITGNHANPEIHIQRRPLGEHKHAPDDDQIRRRQFVDETAALLRHDPTLTIRTAYNIVFDGGYHHQPDIPTFPEIRSQLQRVRMALCPPIPRQITDVQIDGVWAESCNGQRRLLLLDNQAGIAVFATDEELIAMQQTEMLYFDATFRTTPHPYSQIVSIHGLYRNTLWIIPLGMALLGGKTQAHYEVMLKTLKEGVLAATGIPLTPRQTMTDFEAALMQAIRAEFPETRPYGCYFHFCSSLYRKIQDLGLQVQYTHDEQLKNCARKLMSIGYLPLAHVRGSFDILRSDPMTEGLFAQYPALRQFFAYFEDTYLIGSLFPPETWNVHDREITSYNNNAMESFHSRWNMEVSRAHPSLWAIIRCMKKEGKRTEAALDKALLGDRPKKIKRKWRQLKRHISRLRTSLQNGDHNLAEFWAAVVDATDDFH